MQDSASHIDGGLVTHNIGTLIIEATPARPLTCKHVLATPHIQRG